MSDYFCFVFFKGDFSLTDAERVRMGTKLSVSKQIDKLVIRWNDGPEIRVVLDKGSWIQREASEIGANSLYAEALSKCNARFEITFDALDQVLNEINTLIEVQINLQEVTGGFLFNSWNGELSASEAV